MRKLLERKSTSAGSMVWRVKGYLNTPYLHWERRGETNAEVENEALRLKKKRAVVWKKSARMTLENLKGAKEGKGT